MEKILIAAIVSLFLVAAASAQHGVQGCAASRLDASGVMPAGFIRPLKTRALDCPQ
jgi:hypothetical protein